MNFATVEASHAWNGRQTVGDRHFLDPYGSQLPALEKNMLKLRAMQMVLIMFYAEELKRKILDLVQTTDKLRAKRQPAGYIERVPVGAKKSVDKALNALIVDNAITPDEKAEIVSLIDYRNDIGHRIHELFADISSNKFVRDFTEIGGRIDKPFDYEAVERLQYFRRNLEKLHRTHHYVGTLKVDRMMFEDAERTFLQEIGNLRRKVRRRYEHRNKEFDALNKEILLEGTEFDVGERQPGHPLQKYDNGRLTHRGVEICYRLFDSGRSLLAVAHLMEITLGAARHRQKLWSAIGESNRPTVDFDNLPRRKFYQRYDE